MKVESVEAQFGPALPLGAKAIVVIKELPEPVAKMAEQFKHKEM